MARGSKPGERRGGRTKGTPNKRTSEQRQAVVAYVEAHVAEPRDAALVDPVDALCELTQWAMDEFRRCGSTSGADGKPDPELMIARAKLGLVAADWAAKAAPYIRPRLAAVEASVNVNITIFERIDRGRTRALIAA